MRLVVLMLVGACSHTRWLDWGKVEGDYVAIDGKVMHSLETGPELAFGYTSDTEVKLCYEHALEIDLGTLAPSGDLGAIEVTVGSPLCDTGFKPIESARESVIGGAWTNTWTIDGAIDVTSYVRHGPSPTPEPPPQFAPPSGTPLESITGTFFIDATDPTGKVAHVENGTFELHTSLDTLSGWGD